MTNLTTSQSLLDMGTVGAVKQCLDFTQRVANAASGSFYNCYQSNHLVTLYVSALRLWSANYETSQSTLLIKITLNLHISFSIAITNIKLTQHFLQTSFER